jgi:hypothetical protein
LETRRREHATAPYGVASERRGEPDEGSAIDEDRLSDRVPAASRTWHIAIRVAVIGVPWDSV